MMMPWGVARILTQSGSSLEGCVGRSGRAAGGQGSDYPMLMLKESSVTWGGDRPMHWARCSGAERKLDVGGVVLGRLGGAEKKEGKGGGGGGEGLCCRRCPGA